MSEVLEILREGRGQVMEAKSMAQLSWLRVGGPAHVYQPQDIEDLAHILKHIPAAIPVMPVGVGSNLIVRDGGLEGVVIRLGRGFRDLRVDGNTLHAGAALLDAHLARKAAEAGLDLAFLRTIPGSVGGAVRMNAGCYGSYVSDHLKSAKVVSRTGAVEILSADDLGFSYRSTSLPPDSVVVEASFVAETGRPDAITRKMVDALAKRAETQPVDELSCGSTFRNPAGFSSTGRADDVHDLKAWKLIQDAGMQGVPRGGAVMSSKHANFLINTGEATAADLEGLGEDVRKKVFENAGIWLEWEIMRVGKP